MPANPTKENLQHAYTSHKKLAEKGFTRSHKLLLFYAAECGLKCYYLKKNNLRDAEQGGLKDKKYSHKIQNIMRDCNIPNFVVSPPNESGGSYPVKDFHEYMRYGAAIDNVIETSQVNYIKSIVEELAKHL